MKSQYNSVMMGATGGIGKETARGLARMGAHIVLVGRDQARGEAAVEELRRDTGAQIDILYADLANQADVRALAAQFMERYPTLHVLINNAGALYQRRWLTDDGIEASFAVNNLPPFLLTHLLLPVLRAGSPARVINLTGGTPQIGVDFDNLQAENGIMNLGTYSRSKAAMMVTSYEFALRLAGTGVTLNVTQPGGANTPATQAVIAEMLPFPMNIMFPLIKRTVLNAKPERAARSSIYLASSPDVEGVNGVYFSSNSKPVKNIKQAADSAIRARLWALSMEMTGLNEASPPARPSPVAA